MMVVVIYYNDLKCVREEMEIKIQIIIKHGSNAS